MHTSKLVVPRPFTSLSTFLAHLSSWYCAEVFTLDICPLSVSLLMLSYHCGSLILRSLSSYKGFRLQIWNTECTLKFGGRISLCASFSIFWPLWMTLHTSVSKLYVFHIIGLCSWDTVWWGPGLQLETLPVFIIDLPIFLSSSLLYIGMLSCQYLTNW